jgi:hypothetical protein
MRRLYTAVALTLVVIASLAFHGAGTTAVASTQPALPIRAAFYYPWYPETWGAGSNYHPTLGQYDSSDPSIIRTHIDEMQSAGIQAGIASWWGRGSLTDGRVPALLSGAGTGSFRWTLYYEQEGTLNQTAHRIATQLTYIKRHYASQPQYLVVNGKPVIFVYAGANDGCGMADRWSRANNGRFYVVLKVFPGYASCASQPDSWHQYSPASREDQQGSYSFSVSPGFWKAGEATPRLARDPAAFAQAVSDMNASGAQWQLVTTFNEWGEGTAIEPATEWGSTYLDILGGTVPTSPPPTSTPPPTSPPPPGTPLVVIYMENHERSAITTSTSAPYLNGLRARGLDFTHYYGVTHPSLPNYLALGNGSTDGKVGTDSITAGELTQSPTLWNQLSAAGISWKVYEESMPSVCSSAVTSGDYALKHNPATPFHAVFSDPALCANVQPYTPGVPLAQVNFIAPNLCNDMHDCSIATGDNWLAANVEPMLQAGAEVIVTFDEGSSGTDGGGNVYTVEVGPGIAPSVDATTYNHYSTLAGIEARFGLTKLGGAATAAQLPI